MPNCTSSITVFVEAFATDDSDLVLKSVHSELITLALRTLEFWIDNLNAEFLYPIMSRKPILLDLMGALTGLLKPKLANYGEQHYAW